MNFVYIFVTASYESMECISSIQALKNMYYRVIEVLKYTYCSVDSELHCCKRFVCFHSADTGHESPMFN